MPKLTNIRERVHWLLRDCVIRTGGWGFQAGTRQVQANMRLFMPGGNRNEADTNLPSGNVLASDASMVVLTLRVFLHFRNPIQRGALVVLPDGVTTVLGQNGDYAWPTAALSPAFAAALNGQAIGIPEDVHRLYMQTNEAALWFFGAGSKFSIESANSWYLPAGGGLQGDIEQTDLIYWSNGMPGTSDIARLGRAVLIPPRQGIKAEVQFVSYDNGGNGAVFQTTQGVRDMLSPVDNLNAVDGISKCVALVVDGLFSRDVQ